MILLDAAERFGPLSEAIQAKGAIALAAISRSGMFLDVELRDQVQERLRRRLDDQVAELEKMPGSEGLFQRDRDGRVKMTERGQVPSKRQATLRRLLTAAAEEIAADDGKPVAIPRTESGQVSTSTTEWEKLAVRHPFVRAWIELEQTAKTLQFFNPLSGPVIHPRYTTMVRTGRTSCSNPNIQNLPRKGGLREAFRPSPGHLFLTVDYGFIELRTLAAECEARYGESKLAGVIRAGIDPHCYTAAMFEGMELNAFMALKTSADKEDRERFATFRQRAKVLNFGIPGGLGVKALVAYAHSTYNVTLSLEEAAAFRERLIRDVYPELGLYLADDGMEVLADNLGVSVLTCWKRFDRKGDRSPAVVGGIRNVVRGKICRADGKPYYPRYLDAVWSGLAELNRDAELAPLLVSRCASEELQKRLFRSRVTTLTGRVRGRVSFTQARNTPFQGLAADGAKLALWALVREGYRVVAFIHDEVVIELPEDADHTVEARRIEAIMNQEMERVTGDVPVACEYALSRRWSKKAKAVFDETGRLVPCEIDLK
jgi:hypothetical protein